jgi:alanine racemase
MEGVFTHFSKADELDKTHCRGQIKTMGSCVRMLEKAGLKPPMIHSANSAGIIDSHLLYDEDDAKIYTNTYRMGISMYGFYPSEDVDKASIEKLKPTMTWKTKIVQLKELTPGHTISYGGEYITSNPQTTRIATLPVGYADGYRRRLGRNKPLKPSFSVLVGGKVAPIVGRVCMDMCHIDVTHIPEVSVGAEVVLMGRQGKEEISGDLMAAKLKTINYEITCLVGKRVPRLFKKGDEFVGLKSIISDVTVDPNSL